MKLKDVLIEWKRESDINPNDLSETTVRTARLHTKYLEIHAKAKADLYQAELEFKRLALSKRKWYEGKLTKEEISSRGWKDDPFDGHRAPPKSKWDDWLDGDEDLQKAALAVKDAEILAEALREIVSTLNWRHQSVRNVLEWKKFEAGF